MTFRALVGAVLLGSVVMPLCAQQQLSPAFRRLEPFADSTLHRTMEELIAAMDAFDAARSMALVGRGLRRAEQLGDAEARYYFHTYRAEVLYYEGLFNEAMRDLDKAADLAQPLNDSTLFANLHNLKGLLHENIQDSRLALPHLREALAWFPQRPAARYPVTELHHIHGNLGSHLTTLGRLDSAAHHLHTSLQLARAMQARRATAVAHWSLGNLALRMQRPDSALWHFDAGFAVAEAARDRDVGLDVLIGRAQALAELGRPALAREALDHAAAYQEAHRAGIGLVTQRNFARAASACARTLGQLERSLDLLAQWHRIDSTITAHNIHTALATQEQLIRTDNDLDVARLEQQRTAEALAHVRRTRWFLVFGALLSLLALTAINAVNNSRLRGKQQLVSAQLDLERKERLITELRIREEVARDMHDDLGAGLSALKFHAELAVRRESDPLRREAHAETAAQAGELIASMRQIVWALQGEDATLADLAAYITGYARRLMADQGLELEVQQPPEWPPLQLGPGQRRNLFLVVKEALNNVTKHARASRVALHLQWEQGLRLRIADNGQGLGHSPTDGGNGLRNIRSRVERMHGTFSLRSGHGTTLEVFIPEAALNKS